MPTSSRIHTMEFTNAELAFVARQLRLAALLHYTKARELETELKLAHLTEAGRRTRHGRAFARREEAVKAEKLARAMQDVVGYPR